MPNFIIDLEVDRVDLVDEGANSAAFIKLYKRKEQEPNMTLEEILAKMKPEHAKVIQDELAKVKQAADEAEQKLQAMTEDLEKAKADYKAATEELENVKKSKNENQQPDFEEVIKSLDPAVQEVFKSLKAQKEAAEELARQAAEEKRTQEALAKAKELKALPVEETKLVEVIKGITPEVYEILKAANKALEDAGLLDEIGKSRTNNPSTSDEAWQQIEKKAEEIVAQENVSKAKAISLVIKRHPDLYREYLKGGAN
ncbi:MAG: hypothetical protein GX664_03925 [Bacteroidales bacterium]|nr:hypothetical protein [Bacteroidales bacterium]